MKKKEDNMSRLPILLSTLLLFSSLDAQEVVDEEYDIEEEASEEGELCIIKEGAEPKNYSKRYHCPQRYNDYYDYEDKDIDATWPGKRENSFMDNLMR